MAIISNPTEFNIPTNFTVDALQRTLGFTEAASTVEEEATHTAALNELMHTLLSKAATNARDGIAITSHEIPDTGAASEALINAAWKICAGLGFKVESHASKGLISIEVPKKDEVFI